MMRLGAWTLALVMALALVGCSSAGNGIEDASGQSESSKEQSAQEGEPLAQRARGASQESDADDAGRQEPERRDGAMRMSIDGTELAVEWEDNQAVADLAEMVADGPLTIQMSMYGGWEQVGPIGAGLTSDYLAGEYQRAGGVVDPLPADAPQFVKDYYSYYKTTRGFHVRSGNSTDGWNTTSNIPWANTNLLQFAHEIESAVMVLHGEKAHSRYMGEMIFDKLQGNNKQLAIVPGASHCDLYDGGHGGVIPWDEIEEFFGKYL